MLAYVESADERDRDDLHGREEDRPVIVQLKPTDLGCRRGECDRGTGQCRTRKCVEWDVCFGWFVDMKDSLRIHSFTYDKWVNASLVSIDRIVAKVVRVH
ncbi:unnamed protein product [Sphagnum balticum]